MKMQSGVRFLLCRLLTPSPHTGRMLAYQPRRWNDLILADRVQHSRACGDPTGENLITQLSHGCGRFARNRR